MDCGLWIGRLDAVAASNPASENQASFNPTPSHTARGVFLWSAEACLPAIAFSEGGTQLWCSITSPTIPRPNPRLKPSPEQHSKFLTIVESAIQGCAVF